ncbi:MAG: hypothetical protein SFW65_01785 [Alphaproteobacteria bacterium]|nr:hypothetical protein [Alphaproteobacteria bacterium]
MQWIIFGILAIIVVSGVRRMAREDKPKAAPFSSAVTDTKPVNPQIPVQDTVQCPKCGAFMVKNATCNSPGCMVTK